MTTRISIPIFGKEKNYERFKQELLAWREITELSKEKQGIAVALTLPENDETQIREKVFDQLHLDDLKSYDGLKVLIHFLDQHLAKDDLTDSLEKFEDFEDFKRLDGQSIAEFVSMFDVKYRKIEKKKMTLPSEILAFKLLRKANISKEEKLLVLTGMNFDNRKTLYEEAKKSLKKFKGNDIGLSSNLASIKLEPAFLAANEEALLAAGYSRSQSRYNGNNRSYYNSEREGSWKRRQQGKASMRENYRGKFATENRKNGLTKNINPAGPEGRPLTCKSCGSYRHLLPACPDSWENMKKVNVVEEEHAVLFTGYDREEMRHNGVDARNCAILDSACSSTVCGRGWLDNYIESLDNKDRAKVFKSDGKRVFKFGGGSCLKSNGEFIIPAVVAGKAVSIKTDVVESDIPLLLSRTAMKKAAIKLDIENDRANILGMEVALNLTTSGHYCIPIDKSIEILVDTTCAVNIEKDVRVLDNEDCGQISSAGSSGAEKFLDKEDNDKSSGAEKFLDKEDNDKSSGAEETRIQQERTNINDCQAFREELCTKSLNDNLHVRARLGETTVEELDNNRQIEDTRQDRKILKSNESIYAKTLDRAEKSVMKNNQWNYVMDDTSTEKKCLVLDQNQWELLIDAVYPVLENTGHRIKMEVYIKPPKKCETAVGNVMNKHGSYRLKDGEKQFNLHVKEVLLKLVCKMSKTDPTMLFLQTIEMLGGVICCHVNDGDKRILMNLRKKLVGGVDGEVKNIGFKDIKPSSEILIDKTRNVGYTNTQTLDTQRVQLNVDTLTAEEKSLYRQVVGLMNGAKLGTRQEMVFYLKPKQAIDGEFSRAAKTVNILNKLLSISHFSELMKSVSDWRILIYPDGSTADIFVCFAYKCGSLVCQTNLIIGGGCLTIVAEKLSKQEDIGCEYYCRQMQEDIMELQWNTIPMIACVDNKSIIDPLHSTKEADDKRLRIAIATINKSLSRNEVKDIRWCPGKYHLADCMTKRGASGYNLLEVFHGGRFSEEFI